MLCQCAIKACWAIAFAWERPFTKLARDVLGAYIELNVAAQYSSFFIFQSTVRRILRFTNYLNT